MEKQKKDKQKFAKRIRESLDAMISFADQQIKLAQKNPEEESVQNIYDYLVDRLEIYIKVLNTYSRIPWGVIPRVNYLIERLNRCYDELEKGPNKFASGFWFNSSLFREMDEDLARHPFKYPI